MTDLPANWQTGDLLQASDFDNLAAQVNTNTHNAATDESNISALQADHQSMTMTGTVGTAASTAAKTVTLDAPWQTAVPQEGDFLWATFTLGNSASAPTLAVNGLAAVPITGGSGSTSSANTTIAALDEVLLYYDGVGWHIVSGNQAALSAQSTAEVDAGTSTSSRVITAVIAKYIRANMQVNPQTGTAYTLALTDAGLRVTMNNAAASVLTIPTNASVALPVGTRIPIAQLGAGQVTVTPASGVTLNARVGKKLAGQFAGAELHQYAANTWLLTGDLSA